MNQRRSKKLVKRQTLKTVEIQVPGKTQRSLPTHGCILIGKTKAFVPYVDQIEKIVSSETDKQPIKSRKKAGKGTRLISSILRKSGIESLIDIGDAMLLKF